jgi:hypothetical protein
MSAHNYLYSASCIAGQKLFINASNNTGTYAIYSSTISNTTAIFSLNHFDYSVFPNPTNDYVNINAQEKIDEIRIRDLSGRIVKSTIDNKIFVGDLLHSIYLLDIVRNDKIIRTFKIIVE